MKKIILLIFLLSLSGCATQTYVATQRESEYDSKGNLLKETISDCDYSRKGVISWSNKERVFDLEISFMNL